MDRHVARAVNDLPEADAEAARRRRLRDLFRWIYPLRVFGMTLGLLPVLVVLREMRADWPAWGWAMGCCLAWPHLAWLHARLSADSHRAELRNLLTDSALVGSLIPVIGFNLLPSVGLVAVAVADKINSGVRGMWQRSLLGMLGGLVAAGLMTGFQFRPDTSMAVLVACLPLLILHTLATSVSNYRLVRRVQQQNQQLEMLRCHDALTGLESRSHWEEMADALRARCGERREASILLLDADGFKSVNDGYGHAVGDDLLRAIAACVKAELPEGGHAGRLGGDEFVVALPLTVREAVDLADAIHARVRRIELAHAPDLRASVSIGAAAAPQHGEGMRAWLEAADRMLYRAKEDGRGCTRSTFLPTSAVRA